MEEYKKPEFKIIIISNDIITTSDDNDTENPWHD